MFNVFSLESMGRVGKGLKIQGNTKRWGDVDCGWSWG